MTERENIFLDKEVGEYWERRRADVLKKEEGE